MSGETLYWKCRVCGDVLQTDAKPDVDERGFGTFPPDENDPPMCDDCIGYRNMDISMHPVAVVPLAEWEAVKRLEDAVRATPAGFASIGDYRHYLCNVLLGVFDDAALRARAKP